MAKKKPFSYRERASKEAIENFCILNNCKAVPAKRGTYKYYTVMENTEYGVTYRFDIGKSRPIEAWVRALERSKNYVHFDTAHPYMNRGRWTSKQAMQVQNLARITRLPNSLLQANANFSEVEARLSADAGQQRAAVWMDEVTSLTIDDLAKIDLRSHLTDAMAYGTSLYRLPHPVSDAGRSDPQSRADGDEVPHARPKFMGIERSRNARAVQGRHRHSDVRSQMGGRDANSDRKAHRTGASLRALFRRYSK